MLVDHGHVEGLAIATAVVFAVNLLPAFGPPTWAIIAYFAVRDDVPMVPLVACGAVAAASGRLLLATASAHSRDRLSPERRANLEALQVKVTSSRRGGLVGLALFALSPVPSAQLFVAAGLTGTRLVPLTVAFFAGRLVSYSIYASAASVAADRLGSTLGEGFGSPWAITLQVVMLAGIVLIVRAPWARWLGVERRPSGERRCRPGWTCGRRGAFTCAHRSGGVRRRASGPRVRGR